MGRPSNYPPDLCELAHNYCLLGATNDVLAELFGVSPRTIDNWIAGHPGFPEAVQQGRDVAMPSWSNLCSHASPATTTSPKKRSSFITASPEWRPTARIVRPKPGPACLSLAEIAGIPDQAARRAGQTGR